MMIGGTSCEYLYNSPGVGIGNYDTALGEMSVAIPSLRSGLYFIRMDGVVKVAAP